MPVKAKLLIASISVSTLLYLLLLLSLQLTTTTITPHQSNHVHLSLKAQQEQQQQQQQQQQQVLDVAHRHCQGTLHHSSCVSALSTIPNLAAKTLPEIISKLVRRTTLEVNYSASNCTGLLRRRYRLLDPPQRIALQDCLELFDSTLADLRLTLADLSNSTAATARHFYDIETLLSAAITNTYTCRDGFVYASSDPSVKLRPDIESRLYHVAHLVSNSLAMVKRLPRRKDKHNTGGDLRGGGFPTWVSRKDRRLLQAPVTNSTNTTIFNLVVAKDGTGNFTTIGDAVAAAPNNSATRFVIYIKAGAYFENVEVDRSKTNLMFVGDGIGKTVVKASRNVVDGWTTFRSATVAVVGNGFLARDMTFENAAGPSKHQAVALRSGSDLSAFYRCSFVAYQDTLYVHSLRQFYRDCDVYGTVDFIFGNAAVVFQNCNLYARKPDPNQKNIFTAQGREDPNQNTGTSIQNCKIAAAADLIPVQASFKNYLGRPWKNYSRTVVMQSNVGDLIDPAGWLEWDGAFALSTLYYGEYRNRGPGSNTTARVKWPGYRVINSSAEASQFTPGAFIQGGQWLPQTSIPYTSGLF